MFFHNMVSEILFHIFFLHTAISFTLVYSHQDSKCSGVTERITKVKSSNWTVWPHFIYNHIQWVLKRQCQHLEAHHVIIKYVSKHVNTLAVLFSSVKFTHNYLSLRKRSSLKQQYDFLPFGTAQICTIVTQLLITRVILQWQYSVGMIPTIYKDEKRRFPNHQTQCVTVTNYIQSCCKSEQRGYSSTVVHHFTLWIRSQRT